MKLTNRIDLYIPETQGNEQAYQDSMALLSSICGGATESISNGSWVDGSGNLVIDKIHVVHSYYNSMSFTDIRAIVSHVKQLKVTLSQELISVTFAGALHLI